MTPMKPEPLWSWQHSLIVCFCAILLNIVVGATVYGAQNLESFLDDAPLPQEAAPKRPALRHPDSQPLVSLSKEIRK